MKFFVLGYDGHKLITLTRREFDSLESAQAYIKTCGSGWRAFVVQAVA